MAATADEFAREGNALLEGGERGPACLAYLRALDLEPRHAAAHYNLGAVMLMSQRAADSLPCLMSAAMLQPGNTQFTIALARALLEIGDADRAAATLAAASAARPEDTHLRQVAAQYPLSPEAAERIKPIASARVATIRAQAEAALEAGRAGEALELAAPLIWAEPLSVSLWHFLGGAARLTGQGVYAEFCARRVLCLEPRDPDAWIEVSRIVREAEGREGDVERLLRQALVRCGPDADLIAALAAVLDRSLDPQAMLQLVQQARADGADFSRGDLLDAEARAFLRVGELDKAHASIQAALASEGSEDQQKSRHFTLGQIEDKRGRYREAHAAWLAGNALLQARWEEAGPCDHTMVTRRLASLQARFDQEIASGTSAVTDAAAGPDNMAFLVGFPRSGTTLLDTILRTHSRVRVVEERPVLINALRQIVPGLEGDESNFTEDWLDALETADPAALRAAYLEQMAIFAGEALRDDRIYIDKLPLNMNWAPLIHKILPRATFILAQRHPLDAAISNLAQDFKPNNAMLNMTSLARIDQLHDLSFALWEAFTAWRQPMMEAVSYEDVVEDLQATVTRVMTHFGLAFEPAQARYFETARQRGRISTPSANQVTQALYTTSRERWRHYDFAFKGSDSARLRARAAAWGYRVE